MDRDLLFNFVAYLANQKLFKRRRVTLQDAVDLIKGFSESEFNPYQIRLQVTDDSSQKDTNTKN